MIIGLCVNDAMAQKLYGIVRKNYFSIVRSPFDSTGYEQFDSCTIRLGELQVNTGAVSNIGSKQYTASVNLTGAALNPFENTFVFMSENRLNTFNLITGNITVSVPLSNPLAGSSFDNFRFNHSDSTLYGLARRVIYNPVTQTPTGQVFLARINTKTGVITQISPTSVAQGFAMAGSAIDPFQMVYYFSTGATLMGLDLYTGSIFSNPAIQIPNGGMFDNFTYSCVDNTLYGLVRKNYFSYAFNPLFPNDSIEKLDSSTVRLAKINPNTGQVTIISPNAVTLGGYSLNAGSAIDPTTRTFYYNPGNRIVGVSLITGLKTVDQPLTFAQGDYFDLMRNFENCQTAFAKRLASGETVSSREPEQNVVFRMYPNPATNEVTVECMETLQHIQVLDASGKVVRMIVPESSKTTIQLSELPTGVYYLHGTTSAGNRSMQKLVRLP